MKKNDRTLKLVSIKIKVFFGEGNIHDMKLYLFRGDLCFSQNEVISSESISKQNVYLYKDFVRFLLIRDITWKI